MAGRTWVTGPDVELTLHGDDENLQAVTLTGVIDTGASCICVDSRVAKRLGLVASDRKLMQMADGRTEISTIYTARMIIPALDFNNYVQVHAVSMERPSTQVLLGRSFLRAYIVNYNGPEERFEFHKADYAYPDFDHDE